MGISVGRTVATLSGTGCCLAIGLALVGCAATTPGPIAEPVRYRPGVAEVPPRAADGTAPLHRPTLAGDSAASSGNRTEETPACPIFDPFTAEERLRWAMEPLMLGNPVEGRRQLLLALCQDPNDRKARSLLRQLDVAPEKELGTEFVAYRAQPGDTLPGIAKRTLDDPYRFYVLARYNHLAQPSQLTVGQCLRVPGNPVGAASVAADALAHCGEELQRAGDSTLAYAFFSRGAALQPDHPQSREGIARVGPAAARAYYQAAVQALRNQDIAATHWNSDKDLEIEPDNREILALHDTATEISSRLANALYREALAAYERKEQEEVLASCSRLLELEPDHKGADRLLQQAAAMNPVPR